MRCQLTSPGKSRREEKRGERGTVYYEDRGVIPTRPISKGSKECLSYHLTISLLPIFNFIRRDRKHPIAGSIVSVLRGNETGNGAHKTKGIL
jgi:hypothetical protein